MTEKYIVIKTITSVYKCHGYSRKAGRVYFNSRAVNMANVVTITEKDGSVSYENPDISVEKKPRVCAHHVSTLKGAVKCKATKPKESRPTKKSSLPDIIEL
jgi:flagellar basal body rod protein FlgC